MGDHRASIKIEMEFHGIKDKADMWINYSPTECCGMDERVVRFFNEIYSRGMTKYDAQMAKYEYERTREQREESERNEYERLKKKFEGRL